MGIRSGSEFRESIRDGRTIYVDGQRVDDVTSYRPFEGIIETLASLYDVQKERPNELTYRSPTTGDPVAMSFLVGETDEEVERRRHAEEIRCEMTFGLMGRMPDFMNALVTDAAAFMEIPSRHGRRYTDNLARYYLDCRENDWCLTHTLVDPQIDRSKGPAGQIDPALALHRVRETDRGLIVRGARMLSTLAPFANELFVGPFYPRGVGDEAYALCFAIPMNTPGLKFICRESYDKGRSRFDRPLSGRFDEEDALAVFDDVCVPWERVFIDGDIAASNDFISKVPGYALLQCIIRGMVKLKFLTGLACYLAEAVGRSEAVHVQAQLGELVANVEILTGLVRAAVSEVAAARRERRAVRTLAAALWVFCPQSQMRAAEVIRQVAGSGLIMTPTEKDFANSEIAGFIEQYFQGKGVDARRRVQLFKLAWDMIGEQFGSRQLQYEWFYAGDPYFTRSRFYKSPVVAEYKALVDRLLGT
ncbi:4-hydroxyphenylacetate 3-hydroxylase family protein [Candidatus Binatus sp.]|uniref:4-hydroxyphenylacetate 3-hydroxylase family protein n=1 Tax=Candidatus Binatus sp. TaxID=2811406 RepID=UPI003C9FDEA1